MSDARNSRPALPAGVELTGVLPSGWKKVLSPEAVSFAVELVRKFRPRVEHLLERRREMQRRYDAGERPNFLSSTEEIRASDWTVAPIPPDLQDRRTEITGPVDRKMIINALNSGASVFMADFEDSNSPTWRNNVEGQVNVKDAIAASIEYVAPDTGKVYRLKDKTAVLMVRPRGWHLLEKHVLVDGRPATAGLWDFAIYFWNNAKALVAKGSGPYFYLPKLESHLEARLWNEVFVHAQAALGLPRGTVRATCLIETLPAAFEMDEILWELRDHSAGLNCGRWDYIFSFIKRFHADPKMVLPDRAQVTMDKGFLRAYTQLLIKTCHRRNVHAMGGMAAQIPIKDNPEANEAALAKVRADKLREATDGHDGTWVAHPGLVPIARAIFDQHMKTPNQIHKKREDVNVKAGDLLRPIEGTRSEGGLRHNIRVSVQYLEAWLRGSGCVPLYNLMEDAATAEISRASAWQWIHHGVVLDDGKPLTVERFRTVLAQEMDRIRLEVGEQRFTGGRFEEARSIFERMSTQPEFQEFLTLPAYELLEANEGDRMRFLAGGSAVADSPAPAHPDPRRWEGIVRRYGKADVEKLRGSVKIEYTLAQLGAQRLWELLHAEPYVNALGALTGNQAVQMVKAGLKAIYLSGWQVAADANTAAQTYPDQSLYPANSVPEIVRRINRAFQRADQIEHSEGKIGTYWFAPIVADAEAGFGGPLNAYELMKGMIEAGAAAVHFEDQVASEKKCGHLGGKVLVPTSTFVRTLTAARLAADVMGVPTLLVARTDAESAKLIMSDVDPYDAPFIVKGERTAEGFHRLVGGVECAIARGLAYAPFADLIWCETGTPDLHEAKQFAEGIHAKFPGKMLAYNCSPSFNWKAKLDDATIAKFQRELGAMGYKFQFVTLAGFHALNHGMFQLARGYRDRGMAAYSELQQAEFGAEKHGYTATRHQREVGTGYFDLVATAVSGGTASTLALEGSTEQAQFTSQAERPEKPTHGAEQVQRAIEEDHNRLNEILIRMQAASEPAALSATLDELAKNLREHFAHEEHAKGFYGILASKHPSHRAELGRMVEEHQEILGKVGALVSRTKNPQALTAGDMGQLANDIATQIADHEKRELKLVMALA